MLFPDKKRAATTIIASMKPDYVESIGDKHPFERKWESEKDEDYSTALEDAGKKVMAAIERKDVKGFVDYLKELLYLCEESEEEKGE